MLAADPADPDLAGWSEMFLESRGWTIGGGTSEIQRNMLAEHGLGMPRQPR
jgi:alkylation response protein AidB-like acyl-CoA dehydrogenase